MVKIPSFDDIKKAGSNLVDSAKSVKFNDVLDKVKMGLDSVSSSMMKGEVTVPEGDDAVKDQFQKVYISLAELTQLMGAQTTLIRNLEAQISMLGKMVDNKKAKPAPTTTTNTNTTKEKKKT